MRTAVALVFILTALFLYRTGQLYLERKALSREAQQWHRVQAGNTPAEPDGGVEYQGKSYRRNTYIKAILCMGIDRPGSLEETRTAGFGGQADGIFLVAQDTARDRIKVLVIPRDTMTEITLTDLSGNELGSSIQHLTLAYAYGDGREKSCRYMTEAVSRLLGGMSIDGYMAVSMSVLPLANDKVGGVTVTIEEPGLKQADPVFVQGQTVTLWRTGRKICALQGYGQGSKRPGTNGTPENIYQGIPGCSQEQVKAGRQPYSGPDERNRTVHGNGHDKRPVSGYGP